MPYEDRLKQLNLHSLERRRLRGDLIEVYKWMKGFNKGDASRVSVVKEPSRARRNGFKLEKFTFNEDKGKNWFTNRVLDERNWLGSHVMGANTIDIFKKIFDKVTDSEVRLA